jgi:hypothetical protein
MTWTINITGHDDLAGDEKIAYEEELVAKARELVQFASKEGGRVSSAMCTTNTTGSVNLLASE